MIEQETTGFDLADYITDSVLETEGVWRSIGKDSQGRLREVKLARLNNDLYGEEVRKKFRANQALIEQNDEEAYKVQEQIGRECFSKHIIKGLRVDEQEVPYTASLGLTMLKNKDFFNKVRALADQADSYKLKSEEEAVKN